MAPVDKKNCLEDCFPNVYRILMQVVNHLLEETRNRPLQSKPLLLREEEGGRCSKEVDSYIRLVLTSYLVTQCVTHRESNSMPRYLCGTLSCQQELQ